MYCLFVLNYIKEAIKLKSSSIPKKFSRFNFIGLMKPNIKKEILEKLNFPLV